MEYAKDEVFRIRYQDEIKYQERKEHRVLKFLRENYFIGGLIVIATLLGSINFLLIYHFVSLLGEL